MAEPEVEPGLDSGEKKNNNLTITKKKKSESSFIYYITPRIACFGIKSDDLDIEADDDELRGQSPTHLIIMVNGLIGSAQDWKFAAKQFQKKYPGDIVVHCSECNPSRLTFNGVDVMGERLAEEVISVTKRHPSVQKISFVAHSLGGLVARYAVARLYEPSFENGDCKTNGSGSENRCMDKSFEGHIAGLEPINFITSATPHLGSWGHKQVPVFCGLYSLERVASRTSWFLGKSGKHLFLTDTDDENSPLLLRMASDSKDLKYISALKSFRRRVAYANVQFDHLVGWSTSSLRRRNELPKLKTKTRDEKYPHIVNVEPARITNPPQQVVPADAKVKGSKNIDMEEEMLQGLTKLSWERIDVSFHRSSQRYFAHSTIQVKASWLHSDGADVIQHMVDNFVV